MNALKGMDRYRKEVKQVSSQKNDINVKYLYAMLMPREEVIHHFFHSIYSWICCLLLPSWQPLTDCSPSQDLGINLYQ